MKRSRNLYNRIMHTDSKLTATIEFLIFRRMDSLLSSSTYIFYLNVSRGQAFFEIGMLKKERTITMIELWLSAYLADVN